MERNIAEEQRPHERLDTWEKGIVMGEVQRD